MDTNDCISEIKGRAFNEAFFDRVYSLYQEENCKDGLSIDEQEYEESQNALPDILSDEQAAALRDAESVSLECAKWLAEFAFSRGLYVGFQHHFVPDAPARQFTTMVFEHVMQMPKMQMYPEYFVLRGQANDLFNRSRKGLDKKKGDHISGIEATWQQRFFGIVRHAYYLGYRSALSAADKVNRVGFCDPLNDKILATENELGLTLTVAEREMRGSITSRQKENKDDERTHSEIGT